MKLWSIFGGISVFDAKNDAQHAENMKKSSDLEQHNVTINDGRKVKPDEFHKSGFTLIQLEEEPITKDWRTAQFQDKNADIVKFYRYLFEIWAGSCTSELQLKVNCRLKVNYI